MVLAQDELSIYKNVSREDESGEATIDQLAGAAIGQEGGHEAEEEQAPKSAEQVGHPRGEVVLGLAREQGEEHENAAGQDHSVQHDLGLVEGDNDGDGVGLEQSEAGEEQQVGRVGLALPVRQAHEADGAEELFGRLRGLATSFSRKITSDVKCHAGGRAYRNPDECRVRLDPCLVVVAPEAESADDSRHDELRGQDGVHCDVKRQ